MAKDNKRNVRWQVNKSPMLPLVKMTRLPTAAELVAAEERWRRAKPERQTQQKRIKDLLPKAFPPDGRVPDHFTLERIQKALRPLFVKAHLKVPSTDSIARALGRRDRRA
jgi:hypothetical protein